MEVTWTDNWEHQHLKVLVYGASGVGKTYLASTLPNPKHSLIISAEAGLLSLRGTGVRMPVATVRSVAEFAEVYSWLIGRDRLPACIYIDSLSEIAELCLSAALDEGKRQSKFDPRNAYGSLAETIQVMVRKFRDLATHVVFTAKLDKDADLSGRILYRPSFPGKMLPQGLPYLFDEVFALRAEREGGVVRRFLQTEEDGQYNAKDRSGRLAPFEPANLSEVFGKIFPSAPALTPPNQDLVGPMPEDTTP